jgi:hypothetical protein
MTNPIVTRATTTEISYSGVYASYYRRRTKRAQKAPYNLPAPYLNMVGFCAPGGPAPDYFGSPRHTADAMPLANYKDPLGQLVMNQSYEKFRGEIYTSAGLGVDFVEYHQTLNMFTKAVTTLVDFTKRVKHADFVGAARALKMQFVPPGVKPRRAWASNWLEYHFGVEPLLADIHDCAEIFNNPLKTFHATKGRSFTFDSASYNTNFGSVTDSGRYESTYVGVNGGTVRSITSQTFHTLDQLGIINPASLVWEVVPFSFVVDWFVNVGDMVRSLSDFAGLSLEKTYNTFLYKTFESGMVYPNPGFYNPPPIQLIRHYTTYGLYAERRVGLWQPVFLVKSLRLPSNVRAATAIALLTQFLKH